MFVFYFTDVEVPESMVLYFVSYIKPIIYCMGIVELIQIIAESQVQKAVDQIPYSLRIPYSHLKMSNTSIGQGKYLQKYDWVTGFFFF